MTTNDKALAAFASHNADIEIRLGRLLELADDHFNLTPDEVNWSHAATLEHYAAILTQITDTAFREGEHAD